MEVFAGAFASVAAAVVEMSELNFEVGLRHFPWWECDIVVCFANMLLVNRLVGVEMCVSSFERSETMLDSVRIGWELVWLALNLHQTLLDLCTPGHGSRTAPWLWAFQHPH